MPSVLVVDDDPGHRSLLQRTLSSTGAEVDAVADGTTALSRTGSHTYDVVLLDLMLPDINGVALLKKMLAARPDSRVIVLSAADDRANRVQCLELGACDFVGKPFDVVELMARVRAHFRSSDRRFLTVGEVTLDLDRLSVTTADRTVQLAPREFGLLHHLMLRAGEVCTRKELISRVWGFPENQGNGLVDVYVWRLRHKLPVERIETVRNVGYSFSVAG